MIKIQLTAGSKYISHVEAQAVEDLQRLLEAEDGYIIPTMFINCRVTNREIDALLLLPDAIFLLDFKNWSGQRIEVGGLNEPVRCFVHGAWEDRDNSLPNYEYAARELASRLNRESWLPARPRIYSILVFTAIGLVSIPQVSFAGGDPKHPQPKHGVSACRMEQLPQLIAAFRAANPASVHLNQIQLAHLAEILVKQLRPSPTPRQRRIGSYVCLAEHYKDPFLGCTVYVGEGEPLKEPVWIKEYEQILAPPDQRSQKEQLVLRHADILHRFPQHQNIVAYRAVHATASNLSIILERKPGAFLSELLSGKPFSQATQADLQRIPFDLSARFHILGGLLNALAYLTQQLGFKKSAYRDLRPDSIFVQFTDSVPIAQLFNFDCTKLPGSVSKLSYLKQGQQRSPIWDDYASPELLAYITSSQLAPGDVTGFTGDVRCDLFSWGVIAWELLTGTLPFSNNEDKLAGRQHAWPTRLDPRMQMAEHPLLPTVVQLIQACLEPVPLQRPDLMTLRSSFQNISGSL